MTLREDGSNYQPSNSIFSTHSLVASLLISVVATLVCALVEHLIVVAAGHWAVGTVSLSDLLYCAYCICIFGRRRIMYKIDFTCCVAKCIYPV